MGVCPLRSEYEFETSPHVSCTWEPSTSGTQSPYDVVNAWWPPYAERWNGVSKVFTDGLKEPDAGIDRTEWMYNGCGGDITAVCVLQFRLEVSGSTSAMCAPSQGFAPMCRKPKTATRDIRPFATTNSSLASSTLYRCDLCTPLVQPLFTDVAAGCSFEGFASGAALSVDALQQALPFLSRYVFWLSIASSRARARLSFRM